MPRTGDDHETLPCRLPIMTGAGEDHAKSTASGAETVEEESKTQQARGMIAERADDPQPYQRAQNARADVQQFQFMPGRTTHRIERRIASRKQREVGMSQLPNRRRPRPG